MSRWSVPQTWSEAVQPTSEEFIGWYLTLNDMERGTILLQLLEGSRAGSRCLQMDHEGLYQQLTQLNIAYQEKVAALNDVIVRAYAQCTCGQTEVSVQ